jgi:hypothetical protein
MKFQNIPGKPSRSKQAALAGESRNEGDKAKRVTREDGVIVFCPTF